MRRGGDRRPARQTKASELDRLSRRAVIALVLDDDPAVCEALRAAGYQVEQADWMTRPAALDDAQEREGRT
jgi:thiamine monophosphate synthase